MSKKSFAGSLTATAPAMSFIPSASQPTEEHSAPKEPQEPKAGPGVEAVKVPAIVRIEAKSKRLQLLIKPSLHTALKAKAKAEGDSLNNLINRILEAYSHE